MREHSYGWEKLYAAVSTMATADTSLAERLEMALRELSLLREENLPAGIWQEVQALVNEGGRVPGKGGEGAFAATPRSMDELQRHDMAEKIVSCFVRLSEQ